jgi:hypothetical protein
MTRIGLLILGFMTLIALALVGFSIQRQPAILASNKAGELVFPGLTNRLNGLKNLPSSGMMARGYPRNGPAIRSMRARSRR